MTITTSGASWTEDLRRDAEAHLWRSFAEMADVDERPLRIIVRGEGCHLFDSDGNKYLDGNSQLICVEVGYSFGEEFAEAAADQYRKIGYANNFGNANEPAIALARKLASLAPEGMNRVFFVPSGAEGVEAAWKLARQYFQVTGEKRWKAISRLNAYHGVTMGALSLLGVTELRTAFEPLVQGARVIRNTLRSERPATETEEEFTQFLLEDLEQAIIAEDPSTVAMVIVEPVQNHGGSLVPPRGYSEGVRALCDKYGILLVADEIVTAFGRMGAWFASERYNVQPDIIVTSKGLSSSQASIGAVITSEKVFAPFREKGVSFTHGGTFAGHPVQSAVALKNLEIIERLNLPQRVLDLEDEIGGMARSLLDLPVVVDVRGAGYMWALELTRHRPDGTPLTASESANLYGIAALGEQLAQRGLFLRFAADGNDPILFICPPLVAGPEEFETIRRILREVLENTSATYLALASQ